jgi:hypothetical protein
MHHVMMMVVVNLQSATALYGVLMKKSRCTITVCYTLYVVYCSVCDACAHADAVLSN